MTTVDPTLQQVNEEDLVMRPMVSIPLDVPEEEPEQTDSTEEIDTAFDPRYREPFVGLLYLGHLKKRVVKFGHSFNLSTPTQRERLEAGVIHKRFANTIASQVAWSTLVVALYLDSVDDQPLPEPIGPAIETRIADKFTWVEDNLHNEVIMSLFDECLTLDAQVAATLSELENQVKTAG